MKKIYLIFVFSWTIFFISCSDPKSAAIAEQNIDTQIVLSIGKVKITAYELKKNVHVSNPQFIPSTNGSSQPELFNKEKQDLINKTYFLADAYEKGYDKNKSIDSIVEGAARFMVSQSNGLLEQDVYTEHKFNDDEFEKAIEKSTKEFHIEYLKFKDKNAAFKSLQGVSENTPASFKKLVDKVNLLDVTYKKEILTWPFKGYWGKEEEIFALKNNEVSPLWKLFDGYYLIHVEKINQLHSPKITTDQMKIKLETAERQKTKDMLNVKVYSHARPVIDNKIVLAFSNKLNGYKYGPNHTFIKADFNDILSNTILTYISPLGQTKLITVNNFIDYYNTLFLKGSINNIDDVSKNLNAFCFSDYAYIESVKRGITNQPKFLLDKNNFKNNIIYNIYSEQELAGKDAITEDEINKMYDIMKPRLTQAENVVASVYYFNNQGEAIRKKFNLISDTLTFKGLTKTDKHLLLNYKSKVLPDTLKKVIFDLNVKSNPARMIELNNQYVVVVKEKETGTRVRNLVEVRDLVISQIKSDRLIKNKKARLAELKNKYKPTIDLTNQFNSAIAAN